MKFGNRIDAYKEDILKDLAQIISIPSVCGKPEQGLPFGKEPARALDFALERAAAYGLDTKNVGYYAGHAQYGQGDEIALVMAHVDVVPAGEGWATDPFTFTIKDNLGFGRGASDNKGPAIVALHCLRALKDAGVPAKRRLRVVFGSGEEIGMEDMENYFASEPLPDMGFTPDASYGICNCEKGILHFAIEGKNDSAVIRSFTSGTVVNAVPYKAQADVVCDQAQFNALENAANAHSGRFQVLRSKTGAHVLCMGKASHAANPENGENAAGHLFRLLKSVFGKEAIGTFAAFANEKIGLGYDGAGFGVDCSDEPSGKLTFNLGIVSMDAEKCRLQVDIRYPVTCNGKEITDKIASATESAGLCFKLDSHQAPLYLPADGSFIQLLKSSYEDVTGKSCQIFSMGGGTYARTMAGKGVAFGAGFPEDGDTRCHTCNEFVNIDSLMLHARICLEAMYNMLTCD